MMSLLYDDKGNVGFVTRPKLTARLPDSRNFNLTDLCKLTLGDSITIEQNANRSICKWTY
jgi:hypothetical protein